MAFPPIQLFILGRKIFPRSSQELSLKFHWPGLVHMPRYRKGWGVNIEHFQPFWLCHQEKRKEQQLDKQPASSHVSSFLQIILFIICSFFSYNLRVVREFRVRCGVQILPSTFLLLQHFGQYKQTKDSQPDEDNNSNNGSSNNRSARGLSAPSVSEF